MIKSFWVLGLYQGFDLQTATKPLPGSASFVLRDAAVVVGVVLVLAVLLFVGARYYVKHRPSHRRSHPESSSHHRTPAARAGDGEGAHRHRRRRRRRRGDPRSRNPTLAEAGGLPPLRAESEPRPPA